MRSFDLILALFFLAVVGFIAFTTWKGMKRPNDPSAGPAATPAQTAANPSQIAQDMRITKTSRVADALDVVDELGKTSPGFRHYCELVGTAQTQGGVVAPYSQRKVAYYEVRCYRIERVGGADRETLVANEHALDPFYFTDGSSSEKVYVDVASFGGNRMLVNSRNHVEGPQSDFAKAVGAGASSGTRPVPGGTSPTAGAPAAASGLASDFGPGMGDPGFFAPGLGGFMGGMPLGGYVMGGMPGRDRDSGAADVLVGMGMGALIGALAQQGVQDQLNPQAEFRGYRVVEDVVPLGSSVYCLGELYRAGDRAYVGRSVSKSYPSSYFACKPEAEVEAALSGA